MTSVERKCLNCLYFPCLKVQCNKNDGKCNDHKFEHEDIKIIDGGTRDE